MSELMTYIEVSTPQGVKIAQLDQFLKLTYARAVNDIGTLVLELDPNSDASLYQRDTRLGVWRQGPNGALALDTECVWLVRKVKRVLSASGERRLRVTAYSANELLRRRIVAYAAGSAQASKSGYADDLMKAIVSENLGSDATDTDRDISAYLTIESDLSAGQSISKAFSRRNVLTVLQELADASAEAGTNLYFDVVTPTPGALVFATYTGQRGDDRTITSNAPLLFSPELGNLADGELEEDYANEVTVVYAAGRGEGDEREVVEVEDTTRSGASPFNRIEALRDARNAETTAELTAEGNGFLKAGRPRLVFGGSIVDTPQCRYGVEWKWGDKVTVQFEGYTFDAHIAAVSVTIDNGSETVTAALKAEEVL
jgi:hypothetical protein